MLKLFELETTNSMDIRVPTESYVGFKQLMFQNGLTTNQFFSHIVKLADARDPLAIKLVASLKEELLRTRRKGGASMTKKVRISKEGLYDLLESHSPLSVDEKRMEEEEEHGDVNNFENS